MDLLNILKEMIGRKALFNQVKIQPDGELIHLINFQDVTRTVIQLFFQA